MVPSAWGHAACRTQLNDHAGDDRITVIDGNAVGIVRTDGVELNPDRVQGRLPGTIDAVFDMLERNVTADTFTADYDPRHGHPVEVHINQVAEGVDDELDVQITDLTTNLTMPAASRNRGEVGERVEAATIDWSTAPASGGQLWLLVEANDGTVIDRSSRLAVRVRAKEVTCGETRRRPVDSLQSFEGGVVSFELAALDAPAPPIDAPNWAAGIPVTGRRLRLPTCPPPTN